MDPLEKLRGLDPSRYGIRALVKVREHPVRFRGAWGVYLCTHVRDRWIKLRRLTREELDAVGMRPTVEQGYDSRAKHRFGLDPREAAEEAARRISEATGLPILPAGG